jgi:hypothetical protein
VPFKSSNFYSSSLVLICARQSYLGSIMAQAAAPQGQLTTTGVEQRLVRLENENRSSNRQTREPATYFHVWSSIIEAEATLTDAHVAYLVRFAQAEMVESLTTTQWRERPINKNKKPAVMSAFVSESRTTVVLCSSIKRLEGTLSSTDYISLNHRLKALLDNTGQRLGGWHRNAGPERMDAVSFQRRQLGRPTHDMGGTPQETVGRHMDQCDINGGRVWARSS